MAILGHWNTLAEAQKLSQNMLLQGIVETVIESGQLLARLPVKQLSGLNLDYNREVDWTASSGARFYDIGDPIGISKDVQYEKISVPLKRIIRQDPIDEFLAATYNNINDYRSVAIQQLIKRVVRFTEHKLAYADLLFDPASESLNLISGGSSTHNPDAGVEFDGIHALVRNGTLDIDGGEAGLSISSMRELLDEAKVPADLVGSGNVIWLMPRPLHRRLSEAYMERGIVNTNSLLSQISTGVDDIGRRVMSFDGIPIIPSDYLVAEQANTGTGVSGTARIRALHSSGDEQYSVFLLRFGSVEDGGLELLFGGEGREIGEVFRRDSFERTENYDAGMERLTGYLALALGAVHSLGRIRDIENVAVTA